MSHPPSSRDRTLAAAIEHWFSTSPARRRLPWRARTRQRDPYIVLVSEAMLQQTQVSRVLEKFPPFLRRFPTLADLAAADEQDVLALWSGLGYYRRARNLHAAAKAIVQHFQGRIPAEVDQLRQLPGIGRYTAGAIASIAFGRPAPIVDGNVARVLLRVQAPRGAASTPPQEPGLLKYVWSAADRLVRAAASPGVFNEGVMELGAVVCLPAPRPPACDACPLAHHCRARRRGLQQRIPAAKAAALRKPLYAAAVLITRPDGHILVERRPDRGLWAGLWQAPTLERPDRPPTPRQLRAAFDLGELAPLTTFPFTTTHRDVIFHVWTGTVAPSAAAGAAAAAPADRRFLPPDQVALLPLSSPQRRILLQAGSLKNVDPPPAAPAAGHRSGTGPAARSPGRRRSRSGS